MHRLLSSLCIATATLLAFATNVQAQPVYTITPIGEIPSEPTSQIYRAYNLNDKGEVVGSVDVPGGIRGFFWRNGQITEIEAITGPQNYLEAFAVNNRSQVVGSSGFRPFLWENGNISDMGFFPGQFGIFPWEVNDWGQTTGTAAVNGEDLPYLSTGNTAVMLDALPGQQGTQGVGQVNNLGVAAGASGPIGSKRAVVWFTGSSTPHALNVLPGVTNSGAYALNDVGQILVQQDLPQGSRLTVWKLGRYTVPSGLHGEDVATSGRDLNNGGQIVGSSFDSTTSTTEPVVWVRGTAYRVQDLIAASDPLKPYVQIMVASKINDRGQILVAGVDSRGTGSWSPFLLTPVPTP